MGKFIKIFLVLAGGLLLLGLAAVLILPKVIDVQKYKPMILEKVSAATGRQVSLGGDLRLSLFPWVGVSFSDFRLGSPEGFASREFVAVKSFEAHVKLMPLLSQEVQVESFIVDGLEVYLEKQKDGRGNWQDLGGSSGKGATPAAAAAEGEPAQLGLKSIEVTSFIIRDARLSYVDQQLGLHREISGLTLQLTDVNLDRPVAVALQAVVDGKPLAVKGSVGPLGATPGEGILPLDLTIGALDQFSATIKGQVENPAADLSFDLALDIAPFSPRKLVGSLQLPWPLVTNDPAALDAVALAVKMKGTARKVTLTDGRLAFDGSTLEFNSDMASFSPVNVIFEGKLDAVDLDRYLPPKSVPPAGQQPAGASEGGQGQPGKTDYVPLRKLTLDTKLTVGDLKVRGGSMQNVQMRLVAKDGVFQLNPFAMGLYGGNVASTATVNVQGKAPATSFEVRTTSVQVGPLLKAFASKDVLEGTLVSNVALTMIGDTPETIKKSLNGKGELLFTDGAIVGIDLAGMVRNVQTSFGLGAATTEKPRTDFAELRAPFTIKNGLVNTPETAMQSPLIRLTVMGDANLVNEALDMKVQPKFVATLKGQGDTADRKGLMVPVLVRGTFSSPEFSPDLTALLQGQLPSTDSVKKVLEEGLSPDKVLPKDQGTTIEQGIKGLIPKLQKK